MEKESEWRQQPYRAARIAVFLLVVAMHVGMLAVFTASHRVPLTMQPEPARITYITPPPESAQGFKPSVLTSVPKPAARQRVQELNPEPAAESASRAADEGLETRTPAVDWLHQGSIAVQQEVEEAEAARSRSATFGTPANAPGYQLPADGKQPEFAWNRTSTERVQVIDGAGILVRINDRCAVMISVMVMPACKIGKIEARGDLFEHMNDPPQLGDWKDP